MFTIVNDIDRMFGAMDLLRKKMDRQFGGLYRPYSDGLPWLSDSSSPRTNFLEDGDTFKVQVEVPGISKDDLDIKTQGNYLEVSGKHKIDKPEGYKVHRNERAGSEFTRSFTLPADVDADKVEAELKDGILYLTLPKSETAKPKQITIH